MAEEKKKGGSGSLIKTVFFLGLFAALGFVSYNIWLSWQPRDLSGIAGRELVLSGDFEDKGKVAQRLRNAIARDQSVTFTEEEINIYLNAKLEVKQEGLFGLFIDAKGIWVDFSDGRAEVIIEREADYQEKLYPHTVSMIFEISRDEEKGSLIIERPGGQFGQCYAPGGYVVLVMSSFKQLYAALSEEAEMYQSDIYNIVVEDGKITFDAKVPDPDSL
ncbi:hypothetical protein [Persicirhabdus sediminis]|uniref:Uncharacterized protein n=1 Tax=Persicirhabdus sediminis TaxID=454144 RepID=A0A8J7MEZ8_9BACT|nr:hypothetical protein [Persicirhabdus sediminis]MBK1792744.1 hypothetical protein [Persicirhabdus sediminis]